MVSLHCTQNNILGEWSETCAANSQWICTASKHCIDETTGYQYALPLRLSTISLGWRASERISRSYIVPQLILIIVLLNISCIVAVLRLSRLYIRSMPRGFEIARYAISRDDFPNRQQPPCQRRK